MGSKAELENVVGAFGHFEEAARDMEKLVP
jgi:hypothetical protein